MKLRACKNNWSWSDFRLWGFEFISLWVFKFISFWVYKFLSSWVFEFMSFWSSWVFEFMSFWSSWVMPCNRLRWRLWVYVFSVPLPIRVHTTELLFCLVLSKDFNIMSALSAHQLPTTPQKIDSRGGLFWCKKGWVVNASKMNTHCIKSQFVLVLGLFLAKFNAFWC